VPLLFLLFTVVPVLELWLLIRIGGEIGALPTIALLLVTGLAGAWLAKREGRRVLQGWRRAVAEGRMPEEGILSGALVLAGGVLLVSPGVLTDVLGLALLFPPTRRLAARALRRSVERRMARGSIRVFRTGGGSPPEPRRGEVIDVTPRGRDGGPR
jgi:UPF0716 protein FxsA